MSNQLNIRFDENPELLELLRKICKVRGYRINDYLVRVLTDAINTEVANLANNETIEPPNDRIKKLETDINELRTRLDKIESKRPDSFNASELVTKLSEMLDAKKYPQNNSTKLKQRITEIITELMN